MSTSARILKNTGFLYIRVLISIAVSLYTARATLDILGISDFGLYNLIAGVVVLFGFFQGTMTRASVKYMCFYKGQGDVEQEKVVFNVSFWLHFGIASLIGIFLFALTPYIFGGFLNIEPGREEVAHWVYYFMVANFLLIIMTVPYDSILNANENMFFYTLTGIVEMFSKLGIVLILPFCPGDKLFLYGASLAVVSIGVLLVKRLFCHHRYEECVLSRKFVQRGMAKKMVTYAGWNFLTSISSLVTYNSLGIILNRFWGTTLNAAQGIANQVNGTLMSFSQNMLKALNPSINKSVGERDLQKMQRLSFTGTKLSFLIFALFAIPFIVLAPFVLDVWLVEVPAWAVLFCQLHLLRTLLNQLTTVFDTGVYAQEDIKWYCIVKSIFYIAPVFGIWYAFRLGQPPYMMYLILMFFWEIVGGAVVLYFSHRQCGMQWGAYLGKLFFPCAIYTSVMVVLGLEIFALWGACWASAIGITMLTSVAIAVFAWVILLDRAEREIFSQVAKTFCGKFLRR